MSNTVKVCPFRLYTENVKAMTLGGNDFTVTRFYECLKESCMAYQDGKCLRLESKTAGMGGLRIVSEAEKLINSIGTLAEASVIFYKQLIENGVPSLEARQLTSAFIIATIQNGKGSPEIEE